MAKKRDGKMRSGSVLFEAEEQPVRQPENRVDGNDNNQGENSSSNWWSHLGRGERVAAVAICFLLVAGALGATGIGSSIVSIFASKKSVQSNDQAARNSSGSLAASLNSLAVDPTPVPTPQLSKEYIYAGSRMLAVEDAGANAAPPTDLAVWRPGNGTWYVINSSNQQTTTLQWGATNDLPVRGDFDADGKTDFCVFRPADGVWHQLRSSDNQYVGQQFGATGDAPVPADYDGDGKTDLAVFRSSNLYWYILRSSDATLMSLQFGSASDTPVPADYDGDGKADVAQYRKSTADWIWAQSGSNNSVISQHFGANNADNPVVGDYDGDGKYDFAVWRTTDNVWYINNSSNNSLTAIAWGDQTIDDAVQGDYDADGKTDIAVWRKTGGSVGMWQIRNSSTGQTRTASWGTTGDKPVPAPFRR